MMGPSRSTEEGRIFTSNKTTKRQRSSGSCEDAKLCRSEDEKIIMIIIIIIIMPILYVVGPCHHGMARPQVADRGTASDKEGSCE